MEPIGNGGAMVGVCFGLLIAETHRKPDVNKTETNRIRRSIPLPVPAQGKAGSGASVGPLGIGRNRLGG